VVFVGALHRLDGHSVSGPVDPGGRRCVLGRGDVNPVVVMLLGAAGVAVTDHLWYFTGSLGLDRVVRAFCRWTLNSELCARRTADWFRSLRRAHHRARTLSSPASGCSRGAGAAARRRLPTFLLST